MSSEGWTCAPAHEDDRAWIARESEEVGGPIVVSSGRLHDLRQCPAIVARRDCRRAGLLVYRIEDGMLEILAIKAIRRHLGVGTALLVQIERIANAKGCTRLFLCTTNDNVDALRFYQRRGFAVRAYHVDGFREILRLKGLDPNPLPLGQYGIPARDVVDLGKALDAWI